MCGGSTREVGHTRACFSWSTACCFSFGDLNQLISFNCNTLRLTAFTDFVKGSSMDTSISYDSLLTNN